MPSGSSKIALFWALIAAVGTAHATPAPRLAHQLQPWGLGVFPVAQFYGYTSAFGSRRGPWGAVEDHYGLDIAAPMGSPIRNWWGGRVSQVLSDDRCGVGLVIRSGPYEHIYCHLQGSSSPGPPGGEYRCGPLQLKVGQPVGMGQLIARVGMSGRTSGPHLHWGMRYAGRWLNPASILRAMARSRSTPAAGLAPGASPKSPYST